MLFKFSAVVKEPTAFVTKHRQKNKGYFRRKTSIFWKFFVIFGNVDENLRLGRVIE